ncbi:glycoside hydrolase family 2 protein [Bifidobacterium dentium]|uniref:glycoside hydrolase family 2 protein n=1 Tax=Bifidobacterium dentium TaxID=1689 RepID=UPI003D173C18
MTHTPSTFAPLADGWTLTAVNIEAVPESLREALAAGIPATVPGEATLDLLNAGLIADPFDGANENDQQWIGDVDWRLTCRFDWHDNGADRHDLVAYGLDTIADVALNGRPVASTRNFHRSYRWDVYDLLREDSNELTVTFTSPVRESDRMEQARGYYPHTEHHAFNQIRKPSYSFGWDWGIDVANTGIWREIGIDSWSGVRIASVRPLVDVAADGTGLLNVHVEIERAGKGRIMSPYECHSVRAAVPVHVGLSGFGADVAADGVVAEGRNATVLTLAVPEAKLWWPIGYGDQPLYDVAVTAGDSAEAAWNGHVGFRTVHVDTRADNVGRPFQIYVNDVPVHAHGYNWIPDDAFIARVADRDYERGIRDLVESNSNMVRAWGGGIYESDEFYDLCDRNGIMVWQDFMLACAAYPEDAETKAEVEAEAREHITRLSEHASLIVWNGSNENYVAYSEWGGYKQALRDDDLPANEYGYGEKPWGDYYYAELFPALLAELDPGRSAYLPSSPMSFTKFVGANFDTDGTMHIWDAWNRADYTVYAQYTPRFADEFGYQAPPAWSTLTGTVHDDELEPFGKQMLVHQKASGGNYKLARGMRSHITPGHLDDVSFGGVVNGKPSDGEHSWLIPTDNWADIEDWHWACQLQQAQAMRFGVEHMRSLEPVNAGALIWQLNDDWPVVSWAAVDFNGQRKPLWYASRDFFAPRLATIQPRVSEEYRETHSWEGVRTANDHYELIVLNDTREAWKGSWKVERMTLAGEVLASQTFDVELDAVSHVGLPLAEEIVGYADAGNELVVATASDGAFARVIFNLAEVIGQKLVAPAEAFETVASRVDGGVELKVTATSYVRDLFCMADKIDAKASVDAGMVSLLPGESVTLRIDTDSDDDPQSFAAANVLRSANDLKREW